LGGERYKRFVGRINGISLRAVGTLGAGKCIPAPVVRKNYD